MPGPGWGEPLLSALVGGLRAHHSEEAGPVGWSPGLVGITPRLVLPVALWSEGVEPGAPPVLELAHHPA